MDNQRDMPRWKVGPVEQRITPPIQHSITIYKNGSPLVVYVAGSAFATLTKQDRASINDMAQSIADKLNFG